jgi:hypothetical protein
VAAPATAATPTSAAAAAAAAVTGSGSGGGSDSHRGSSSAGSSGRGSGSCNDSGSGRWISCSACAQPGARMVCGRCKQARYCDPGCQIAHYQTHKVGCRAAQQLPPGRGGDAWGSRCGATGQAATASESERAGTQPAPDQRQRKLPQAFAGTPAHRAARREEKTIMRRIAVSRRALQRITRRVWRQTRAAQELEQATRSKSGGRGARETVIREKEEKSGAAVHLAQQSDEAAPALLGVAGDDGNQHHGWSPGQPKSGRARRGAEARRAAAVVARTVKHAASSPGATPVNAAHRLQVTSPVTLANVGARGAQAVGSEAATTPTMLGRVVDSEPPRHPGPRPRSQVVAPPQNHRPGGARLMAAREDSDAVQARRGEHPPDRRQAQPPVLPSANGLRGNLANCIQRSTRPAGERGAAEEKARGRQLPGPSHAQPAAVPRPMHRAQATRSRPQAALNGNQQARARWSNAIVSGQYEAGVPPPARCKGCGQARVLGFMQAHTRCADDRRDSASPTNPLDVVAPGSCAPLDCQAVFPGQSPACMTKHVSAPVPGLGPATVSCTTSWLSVDGDKSRAELLCAFTGARDEGVALLITALQALGLSGRIRCPAASTSQFTLDDMGLQRHVAVHKVFTCNESIKPAFWREDKVGQQDIGGLTVFRSGYAAVQAERVQRQRWARALIRHGYKSKRALTAMNTSGVAWSDAWEHLRELGIKPECTVKGVHCAPVEDSSMAEYWAIWA